MRALFASTGVKGDDLEPAYYIKELYHPYAINTAPLSAISAFNYNEASEAYLPSIEELEEFLKASKMQEWIWIPSPKSC